MQLGINKCVTLWLQRGKVVKSEGIGLPVGKKIEALDEDQSYKYLAVLELTRIHTEEMKKNDVRKVFKRIKKGLKSK